METSPPVNRHDVHTYIGVPAESARSLSNYIKITIVVISDALYYINSGAVEVRDKKTTSAASSHPRKKNASLKTGA